MADHNTDYRFHATRYITMMNLRSHTGNRDIDTMALVDNGFYHTGEGYNIKCFACGIEIDITEYNQPIIIHRMRSPDCEMVRYRFLFAPTQETTRPLSTFATSFRQDLRNLHQAIVAAPADRQVDEDEEQASMARLLTAVYRYESHRLQSYMDWPHPIWEYSQVVPGVLATSGFYYKGPGDRVRCFDCELELYDWSENDDPLYDHKRFSSECRFLNNLPCGNVRIGETATVSPYGDRRPVTARKISLSSTNATLRSIRQRTSYLLRTIGPKPYAPQITLHGEAEAALEKEIEKQKLEKPGSSDNFTNVCKVCLEQNLQILFLPCRHIASCAICAEKLSECCICKTKIEKRIPVYLA